jgi:hypothetical protein
MSQAKKLAFEHKNSMFGDWRPEHAMCNDIGARQKYIHTHVHVRLNGERETGREGGRDREMTSRSKQRIGGTTFSKMILYDMKQKMKAAATQ